MDNNKIKQDMTRVLNNISKLHYLASNMEYINKDNNEFIKELNKLDHLKIQSMIATTYSENQKAQIELPSSLAGMGIAKTTQFIAAAILGNYLKTKDLMELFINDKDLLQKANDYRYNYIKSIFERYQSDIKNVNKCNCDDINCDSCKFINMSFDQFLEFRCGADQDKLPDFRYLRNHIDILKFQNVFNNASDYHKLVLLQLKSSPFGNI